MNEEIKKALAGVQQQVVDKFLKQLLEDGVSPDVAQRLEKAIVSGSLSEINIKKALLPDETVL